MTINTPQELGRTTYRCDHLAREICLNCIVASALHDRDLRADAARIALVDLRHLARLRAVDGQDFASHWFSIVDRDRMTRDLRTNEPQRRLAAIVANRSVSDFHHVLRAFSRTDGPPKRIGRRVAEIMERTRSRLEDIGREGAEPDLVPILN
jgi:hypothetical protein